MIDIKHLIYSKNLYEKIFKEDANNSNEFSNFVLGKFNSLRIKLEDYIYDRENLLIGEDNKDYSSIMEELSVAYELDTIVNDFINDENGEE